MHAPQVPQPNAVVSTMYITPIAPERTPTPVLLTRFSMQRDQVCFVLTVGALTPKVLS